MIPPADAAAYPGPHPESAAAAASTPKLKQKAKAKADQDAANDRFSTADRTILEELKASIRAREAQFMLKGVGHTVLGGGRGSGKKYHVYPKEIVPYPRSYERDVIDLCVFILLFFHFFLFFLFPYRLSVHVTNPYSYLFLSYSLMGSHLGVVYGLTFFFAPLLVLSAMERITERGVCRLHTFSPVFPTDLLMPRLPEIHSCASGFRCHTPQHSGTHTQSRFSTRTSFGTAFIFCCSDST